MKQQKKISIRLKVITVVLMLAVVAGVVLFTASSVALKNSENSVLWQFIIFTYIYGACCMAILVDFYSVCAHIGNGNSFSMENAHSFKLMARTSCLASAAAFARIIWCFIADASGLTQMVSILELTPMQKLLFVSLVELLVFAVFGFVCRALSSLIVNAAEIKQENDLTI